MSVTTPVCIYLWSQWPREGILAMKLYPRANNLFQTFLPIMRFLPRVSLALELGTFILARLHWDITPVAVWNVFRTVWVVSVLKSHWESPEVLEYGCALPSANPLALFVYVCSMRAPGQRSWNENSLESHSAMLSSRLGNKKLTGENVLSSLKKVFCILEFLIKGFFFLSMQRDTLLPNLN